MTSFEDQTEEYFEEKDYFEEEYEIDDDFYLFGEFDFDNDQDFEWNYPSDAPLRGKYPSPGLVSPTAEERRAWIAFNRELDLTLIPDYEKNSDFY